MIEGMDEDDPARYCGRVMGLAQIIATSLTAEVVRDAVAVAGALLVAHRMVRLVAVNGVLPGDREKFKANIDHLFSKLGEKADRCDAEADAVFAQSGEPYSCPPGWFPPENEAVFRKLPHGFGGTLAHEPRCGKWRADG